MPSNSAANSTDESVTTPSMIGGQRNEPCCSCFQISTRPLVSQTAILNSDFVDVFRRFGSVFRWIEWRDGGSLASGQGGRSAAAAMGLSRLGQSGKTT